MSMDLAGEETFFFFYALLLLLLSVSSFCLRLSLFRLLSYSLGIFVKRVEIWIKCTFSLKHSVSPSTHFLYLYEEERNYLLV